MEKFELVHCWLTYKMVQLQCKKVLKVPPKVKIELPYDPITSLLNIYLYICIYPKALLYLLHNIT